MPCVWGALSFNNPPFRQFSTLGDVEGVADQQGRRRMIGIYPAFNLHGADAQQLAAMSGHIREKQRPLSRCPTALIPKIEDIDSLTRCNTQPLQLEALFSRAVLPVE